MPAVDIRYFPDHGSRQKSYLQVKLCQAWLFWILLVTTPADAQQAVQFLPDDVPALAANLTSRLIYRTSGLRQFWEDPFVTTARLQLRTVLDQQNWKDTFPATGNVAVMRDSPKGGFRITSGFNDTAEGGLYDRQVLDFSNMVGAMLLEDTSFQFDNVILAGIAPTTAYNYSVWQPWRNAGVGYALWPTVILGPNATVTLRNVSVNYIDPSDIDTPEQYTAKVVFGLRQTYGIDNVSQVNSTAARVIGPITIPVLVLNGSLNATGGAGNKTVVARAIYENVTFNCEPWPTAGGPGLSPGALAAAVAVPVAVVTLLACLGAWLYARKRKHRRAIASAYKAPGDIEAGYMQHDRGRDADVMRDQQLMDSNGVVSAGADTPPGSSGGASSCTHTNSSDRTGVSAATPPGAKTPIAIAAGRAAGTQSSSAESNEPCFGAAVARPPSPAFDSAADAAAAAAAAFRARPGVAPPAGCSESLPRADTGASPISSGQLFQNVTSASRSASGNTMGLGDTSSLDTMGLERVSTGRITPGDGPLSVQSQQAQQLQQQSTPALSARSSLEGVEGTPGTAAATVSQLTGSGGSTGGAAPLTGRRSLGGRASGGSVRSQRSAAAAEGAAGSGGAVGTGALGDTSSGSVLGGASRVGDSQGGMSALLKARSELAVLRDLKIGPLLGRGSYGRVYKGRWKAVTVAVKIIEHSEGSPGTASSGQNQVSIGRETFVALNISHPNVVQTYHISTMTISQRNALASSWLKEAAGATSSNSAAHLVAARQIAAGDDDGVETSEGSQSSQSSHSSEDNRKEILETWMLLEFCEKGSLHRAIQQGKFIRRDNREPDMIGIYKALLDTASGLDYLHSIGVVHGDLKTANVLLKGSARDIRGFCCKIADFGLSRVLDIDATHISTRTYGTIVYMPAELLLSGRMTTATDIYSFGLMMWELFTSQPVFDDTLSIGQIFYMIAYQNWRPPVPADCPAGYAKLMTACWHQDPEQRPSVQQLLRNLQRLYVAEKQQLLAKKEAAAAAAGLPSSAAAAAAASRPAVLTQKAVAAQGLALSQPPSPPQLALHQQAAAAAASAAEAAAAFKAADVQASPEAAGAVDAGTDGEDDKRPDRTSFESTTSDRYVNAAASAASVTAKGLPQWSYPGQLKPTPAAAGLVATAAHDSQAATASSDNAVTEAGLPPHSCPLPMPTAEAGATNPVGATSAASAFSAAAAAAGISGFSSLSPAVSPFSTPASEGLTAAPAPVSVDMSSQPSRQSFGSSRVSADAGHGVHSTGGAERSSAGTDGHDEYVTWANAVSRESVMHGSGRLAATRQQSAPLPGHWMGARPLIVPGRQQLQEQQQPPAVQQQLQPQPLQPQLQQQPFQAQLMQQQPQQQSPFGVLLNQMLVPNASPAVGVGGYVPMHVTSEIQLEDEFEDPIVDTIPSESLFPRDNFSSSSNAVYGSIEDAAGDYADTSGFLATMQRRLGHHGAHRQHQHRPVVPAAQGFVEALDMVARHNTNRHAYYQPQAPLVGTLQPTSYTGAAGTAAVMPGQQPLLAGGTALPSSTGQGSSLLPESISGWGSTSTVMPSVLGSSGTEAGMTTQGTPESSWALSDKSSLGSSGLGAPAQQQSTPMAPSYAAATPAAVTVTSATASPFAQAAQVAVTHAAPLPQAAPGNSGTSPFAQAVGARVSRPAVVVHPGSASAGSSSAGYRGKVGTRGSTPERQETPPREIKFMYRTPSGRVVMPTGSTGTLQTVREGSGTESKGSSGTDSRTGSGPTKTPPESSGTAGSRAASLHPAASQDYNREQRQQAEQQVPPQPVSKPAPSPFAALAQRAGSLFSPN